MFVPDSSQFFSVSVLAMLHVLVMSNALKYNIEVTCTLLDYAFVL